MIELSYHPSYQNQERNRMLSILFPHQFFTLFPATWSAGEKWGIAVYPEQQPHTVPLSKIGNLIAVILTHQSALPTHRTELGFQSLQKTIMHKHYWEKRVETPQFTGALSQGLTMWGSWRPIWMFSNLQLLYPPSFLVTLFFLHYFQGLHFLLITLLYRSSWFKFHHLFSKHVFLQSSLCNAWY